MSASKKPPSYRAAIDALVTASQSGQGQVGATRVRTGIWNRNANEAFLPNDHRLNEVLRALGSEDREALATALTQEFQGGVFETLKILEHFGIVPFQDGYEGSAYEDFIGRLGGWEWPEE